MPTWSTWLFFRDLPGDSGTTHDTIHRTGQLPPGQRLLLCIPPPAVVIPGISTEYSRVGLLAGHVHHIYASVPVYTVFAHAAAGQLAPALHMSCLVRGGSKLRRDLSEKAPLPGPLWPSYRAAEISDILAGSWWNLRRIGHTRLTDRMLILHACVPLSWMPSVIWSASTIFFFFCSFIRAFSHSAGKRAGKVVVVSPVCVQPCRGEVMGIIIDVDRTVYNRVYTTEV